MRVRPVRDEDLSMLASIAFETLAEHVEASGGDPSMVTEEFLRSTLLESEALVAEVGGELAGYLQYQIRPPKLIVNGAAIAPRFQRRGLGERLFAGAVMDAHDRGCQEAVISVQPTNVSVYQLYVRLGFSEGENPSGWNQELSLPMKEVVRLLDSRRDRRGEAGGIDSEG